FSYHWVWLVPREALRRSRTVPFHEGIRTELARAVPAGANTTVEGRLLAPGVPGVYWLQWDMVQEGVTWFAQVSPRQPRRLVVVLPSLAGVLSPFPLLILLAALWLTQRWRVPRMDVLALDGMPDVLWCTAILVTKPLILIRETLLEPTADAY